MKTPLAICLALLIAPLSRAQKPDCTFKPPFIRIHFGTGPVSDLHSVASSNYRRVTHDCPSDGYYAYTSSTSDCFSGDWLTLKEDHTPGDVNGNMMIVNASHYSGQFLSTTLTGFKGGTTYEFGVWLMNVCRISEKCPFPLLPNLIITLQSPGGKTVASFRTGDIQRLHSPHWTQHRGTFTMPPSETSLKLMMTDTRPGGCGNDFALDDITFRECVKTVPVVKAPAKTNTAKQPPAKTARTEPPVKRAAKMEPAPKARATGPIPASVVRTNPVLPPPPPPITNRANPVIKNIETGTGEIEVSLYDNGTIDGDTVSIYHNNTLVVSRARLSQKPITFRITINASQPHHELVMVAENLGSIPPNTSVMMVRAGDRRYQVFISSTVQKNAKVVFDLKE